MHLRDAWSTLPTLAAGCGRKVPGNRSADNDVLDPATRPKVAGWAASGRPQQWLLDALDHATEQGMATLTRAALERTGPLPSKSKRVPEEAIEGEAKLAELHRDADPRAAETELRGLLGLAPRPTPAPVLAPATRARPARRAGERKPARDPIGPDWAVLTG